MGKVLQISLKLNFTPNTTGCYGLKGEEQTLSKCKPRPYLNPFLLHALNGPITDRRPNVDLSQTPNHP